MALCDDLEAALKQAQAINEQLTTAAIHQLLHHAQPRIDLKGAAE